MPTKRNLIPVTINKIKKISQARIPRYPVVEARVGNNPEPELKKTSQKTVLLTEVGLYIAQATTNLFGPIPKIGSLARTDLVTDIVAPKDGLTSVFDNPRCRGKISPIKAPDIKNRRVIITMIKEKAGKWIFFSSPSFSLELTETL